MKVLKLFSTKICLIGLSTTFRRKYFGRMVSRYYVVKMVNSSHVRWHGTWHYLNPFCPKIEIPLIYRFIAPAANLTFGSSREGVYWRRAFIRDSALIFLCFNEKQLILLQGALIVVTVQYYVQTTRHSILSPYLECHFRWEWLLKESGSQRKALIRKEGLIGRRG